MARKPKCTRTLQSTREVLAIPIWQLTEARTATTFYIRFIRHHTQRRHEELKLDKFGHGLFTTVTPTAPKPRVRYTFETQNLSFQLPPRSSTQLHAQKYVSRAKNERELFHSGVLSSHVTRTVHGVD